MRGNSNSHAYSYPDGHANGYSDGYPNGNCYIYANTHYYSDTYSYCYGYNQPDANVHTEVYSNAKAAPGSASSPDSALKEW